MRARSSRLGRFTVASWLGFSATLITFWTFWRTSHFAPSGAWALLSIVVVGGAALGAFVCAIMRLWRGPRRRVALALLMIALTPIVWSALFLYNLAQIATHRYDALTRTAGFWVSSIMDAEARWKYPRWTYGRHVVLIDDGKTPHADRLVDQMDAHIERMGALLHQPVPSQRARWVLGELVGQRGRAILAWAICDPAPDHSPELNDIDRHEMAHVVITTLCRPDHEPPALLAEGWATFQGSDRDDEIRQLSDEGRRGHAVPLDELIEPQWYSRSVGPAYSHGGPLVHYLMDRFGGERFFQLYGDVQPRTFERDCQRVLATSWPDVQDGFWQWAQARARELKSAPTRPAGVTLADGIDRAAWDKLLKDSDLSNRPRAQWPRDAAFVIDVTYARNEKGVMTNISAKLRAVFHGDFTWLTAADHDGKSRYDVVVGPDRSGVVRTYDGKPERGAWSGPGTLARADARDALLEAWQFFHLPLTSSAAALAEESEPVRLERLTAPSPTTHPIWTVQLARDTGDAQTLRRTIELDPAFDFNVPFERTQWADGSFHERRSVLESFGDGAVLPSHSDLVTHYPDGGLTVHAQLRPMSGAERIDVQRSVEAAVFERPPIWERVLRPLTLAIAWPVMAMALWGISIVRHRHAAHS
jgi:hypothetical protein